MKRNLSLLISIGVLGVIGRMAYLSSRQASGPQYEALAVAKALRADFQTHTNNATRINDSWSQVMVLLKQQGPAANILATNAIVTAFDYYRKANDAFDPQFKAVNPIIRKYTQQIADIWLDAAEATMAGDNDLCKAKQDEISNLLGAMTAEANRIDPRYLAERWRPR